MEEVLRLRLLRVLRATQTRFNPVFLIDFSAFVLNFLAWNIRNRRNWRNTFRFCFCSPPPSASRRRAGDFVLLGKFGKRSKAKDAAYECGKDPIGEGSARFSVKFYLVAMLFILFDIEVVFMYPWAVVYREMLADHATRNLILGSMVSFLAFCSPVTSTR